MGVMTFYNFAEHGSVCLCYLICVVANAYRFKLFIFFMKKIIFLELYS